MSESETILHQWSDAIRDAARSGRALRLRGGGTKDFYGQALAGEIFDTRAYAGIVAYEPSELVITARCGTPLAELEAELRSRGQMLAFEPPHFARTGDSASFGGMVAAGLSGPRRQAAGALRDFVLGARVLDGKGDVLRFGGQVMKNVAGYDVSRLMAGALGTLGVILEASLKVTPLPVEEASVRLECPEARAIELLNRWGGRPLPISASVFLDDDLYVRLSGAAAAVKSACASIGGERLGRDEADRFWMEIREQTHPFFARGERAAAALWRVSVPSTTPPLALPGEQLIEWGGALRWIATLADARALRDAAKRGGGHATLFRGGDKSVGVFQALEPAVKTLHLNLKREFDPSGIFNRGRMYADF
jgi:glycolate oxidase FAD binding subunit